MAEKTVDGAGGSTDVLVHGYLAYSSGRCRCAVCRRAKRERQAEFRARWRRLAALHEGPGPFEAPDIKHGLNGYDNCCCRCRVCAKAKVMSRPGYVDRTGTVRV